MHFNQEIFQDLTNQTVQKITKIHYYPEIKAICVKFSFNQGKKIFHGLRNTQPLKWCHNKIFLKNKAECCLDILILIWRFVMFVENRIVRLLSNYLFNTHHAKSPAI